MPPYVYIKDDMFTAVPTRITRGTGKGFWREGLTADDFVHEEVLDHLTDKALEVIRENRQRPFFLYFALPAPHTPILPHPRFRGKSNTNAYGDFVLHCDDVVGRVLDELKENGIDEHTLVIFTSDNGCSPMADFAELARFGHNPSYHFRGMKSDIFEGGHRVPLLMRWPEVIAPHSISNHLVCLSDFYATAADILGFGLAEDEAVDSVSLLPLLSDTTHPEVRDSLVHQSLDGSLSLRKGAYKLEMCKGSGGWSYPSSGSEDAQNLPSVQLYNLECDIAETVNVQAEHPDLVAAMRQELACLVREGRSTSGPRQLNDGVAVWETVAWLDD